jgi:archaellum component FlaG (FlaF/FlaG flagellin family)
MPAHTLSRWTFALLLAALALAGVLAYQAQHAARSHQAVGRRDAARLRRHLGVGGGRQR